MLELETKTMKNFEQFKQALIEECKLKGACEYGLEELDKCTSFEDFNYLDGELMYWAVSHLKLEFLEKVSFEKLELSTNNLVKLILFHPQFSYLIEDWGELTGSDWSILLSEQPQFSEYCDWKKLTGYDWYCLLLNNTQFSEHCDWKKLTGYNWTFLLAIKPQFSEYCDWKKLNSHYIHLILKHQPQLIKFKP